MRRFLANLAAASLLSLMISCGEIPTQEVVTDAPEQKAESHSSYEVAPLADSAPHEQRVDAEKLETAYRQAGTLRPLLSLMVLRNGVIVGEDYFHGAERETAYNIKSVSKSIISALVGIALREGFIKSLDQPISDFFPEYFEPPVTEFEGWSRRRSETDEQKRQVTIRHLLTHTSGYIWSESDPLFWAWLWSGDYVRFFLELPFADEPERKFIYNTGGTHALSAILARASGMSTLEFGERYLFSRIGMEVRRWDRAPEGNYIGGAEMHFTARGMARFGLLYLNGGRWDGKEILPEEWVNESTGPRVVANYQTEHDTSVPESWVWEYLEPGKFTGYGYLWWRRDTKGHETFVALGYGGQFIFVIPDLQLVVVASSTFDQKTNPDRFVHYAGVLELLDQYIFPAVEG